MIFSEMTDQQLGKALGEIADATEQALEMFRRQCAAEGLGDHDTHTGFGIGVMREAAHRLVAK